MSLIKTCFCLQLYGKLDLVECSIHFSRGPYCSSSADFPPFEFDRSYLPSSGIPPDCCWSLFPVSCKWPRSLRERLWWRPRRRNLQIPSIFPCKYRPPSKSPRENHGSDKGREREKKIVKLFFQGFHGKAVHIRFMVAWNT